MSAYTSLVRPIVALSAFMFCAAECYPAIAQVDETTIHGASIIWNERMEDSEAPVPGDIVRVHVRGEMLAALQNADGEWRLEAGGEEIPALLQFPQALEPHSITKITISEQNNADQNDLVAVLDRGEWPDDIDTLQVSIVGVDFIAIAKLAVSTDGEAYTGIGEPQIIAQQLTMAGVLKLNELHCPVDTERYLRLTFTGVGGGSLQDVQAWHSVPRSYTLYDLPLAIGQMRVLSEGEHLWPLLGDADTTGLAKLKVLADASGEIRRMRLVRLDDVGNVRSTVVTATWADRVTAAGTARSEKWIMLPLLDTDCPLGIIVDEPGLKVLELRGVQAYAAEGALYFTLPESEAVELWLTASTAPELTLTEGELATAIVAGNISLMDLSLSTARVGSSERDGAGGYDWLTPLMTRWGSITTYALAGLVCIIIGMVLLRQRRGMD